MQSGALGDFSNVCSVIPVKLSNYSQAKGETGMYPVSVVRSALSNAIASGPKSSKAEEGKKKSGWGLFGGGNGAMTRRRRKESRRRRGNARARSVRRMRRSRRSYSKSS